MSIPRHFPAMLALALVALGCGHAQGTNTTTNTNSTALPELPLPLPTEAPTEVSEAREAVRAPLRSPPPLEPAPPLPVEPPRYGGLIGDALVADQPWQLLNPLAPPEYGDGTRNLSVHPTSGRVEGVTLFSIKLFKSPTEKSKKRKRGSSGG
jgi:hypothetical protein